MTKRNGLVHTLYQKSDHILWKQVVLLCVLACLVFREFITGKYLYMIPSDVRDQFVMEMRNLLRLFSESGFPMWSFYRGLGQQSTVGNPSWIGDIFTLVPLLFSGEHFFYLFGLVAALKVVLSGLFFYLFLRELGVAPYSRSLVSLFYAFNGHMLCRGIWIHYATEVVFVALWLWALERFHRGKKYFFPVALALLFVSRNAAYIYIYSGLSFFYVIVRHIFFVGYDWKALGRRLINFVLYYLLGLGLSATLVLPGVLWILQSNRLPSDGFTLSNVFELCTPLELIGAFISLFTNGALGAYSTTGYSRFILGDPTLYAGILSPIVLPQLFFFKGSKKQEKLACSILIGCIVIYYVFPFVREFCNAFSTGFYKTSSFWSIVFLLIVCAYTLNKFETGRERVSQPVLIGTAIFYLSLILIIYCIYNSSLDHSVLLLAVLFIVLIVAALYFKMDLRTRRYLIGLLCILEVLGSAQGLLTDQLLNSAPYLSTWQKQFDDDSVPKLLAAISDEDFYRIDSNFALSPYTSYNWAQYYGYYGVSSYVSIQPGKTNRFYELFDIAYPHGAAFPGFSDRPFLNMLLDVRYYLYDTETGGGVPEGYELIAAEGKFELYKNQNVRPLGYLYHNYTLREDFEPLLPEIKDQASLNYVVLDEAPAGSFIAQSSELKISPLDVSIINTVNLETIGDFALDHMEYTSLNVDPMIGMQIDHSSAPEGGTYLIECTISSEVDTGGQVYYWSGSSGPNGDAMTVFQISSGTHSYSIPFQFGGSLDFLRFDVGDCEGNFTIEDFSLSSVDTGFDSDTIYQEENALKIDTFTQNHITGHVTTAQECILFLSIPYDDGWTLSVNGVEQDVQIADGTFMSCVLPSGECEIDLRYVTPGLIPGAAISGVSLLVWCGLVFLKKRKK